MLEPTPYSLFHIIITVAGISFVCMLAWKLRHLSTRTFRTVIFCCGLFLSISELYKQLFLYYIVNEGHYDWWYFPFQLCSLPMYLCLMIPPFHSSRSSRVWYTFLQDYALLGGIMALAVPSGLMHSYWTLTLHGFFWHFILIFVGLLTCMNCRADSSNSAYRKILILYGFCCAIATIINISCASYGEVNMFYISPYYRSSQIVIKQIAIAFGNMTAVTCYILLSCLGTYIIHFSCRKLSQYSNQKMRGPY